MSLGPKFNPESLKTPSLRHYTFFTPRKGLQTRNHSLPIIRHQVLATFPTRNPPDHLFLLWTPNNALKKALLHANLGWSFLLKGWQKAAIAAYRQALQNNPNSASAYLGLGITLESMGEVKIAKKAFLRAVNLDPRLPSALVHLGYLYAEGHFGKIDVKTARRLFLQASQLGDPFAGIALLDLQSHTSL